MRGEASGGIRYPIAYNKAEGKVSVGTNSPESSSPKVSTTRNNLRDVQKAVTYDLSFFAYNDNYTPNS